MENLNDFKLSTWGTLWKYVGIPFHTQGGFYYVLFKSKLEDLFGWTANLLGLSSQKIPLLGETQEDFFIRRFYTTAFDCFHRPIKDKAATHIEVCLRAESPIENTKQLVIKPGKYKEAINFGSYNYLGFGGCNEIVTPIIIDTLKKSVNFMCSFAREIGISEVQETLEKKLAEFLHKEDCIVIPMGFATNSTIVPILASEGDVIFSDALNHSSYIIGMKSSGAEIQVFKHNDIYDLKSKLEKLAKNGMKNGQQPKKVLVCVEGLYSMEGEFCKLKEIILLKKIYGFYLYVDEAHSIGCTGKTGRGIVEQLGCSFDDVDVLMGTFSKSFASAGGYIASDHQTISLLRSNSYSYVYGSPMPTVMAKQILTCLEVINSPLGLAKIAQLRKNVVSLRTKFIDAGCHVLGDLESPVIPVMVYHPVKIRDVSRICLQKGIAIVVVCFPACPYNACRIRFCCSAGHTDEDIEKGFQYTLEALKETGCIYNNTPQPSTLYHAPKVNMEELEKIEKKPRKMGPLYVCSAGNKKIRDIPLPERPKEAQINISSYDIHNFEKDPERIKKMIKTINECGCGSCGPRNFYGGTLEHFALEEEIKKFYDINEAIVISSAHNILSSVIPVYAKPNSFVLVDEFCNYPIQLGCRLGKAKVLKFKHNNINDLETKLQEANKLIKSYSMILIVTEGVFQHDCSLAPLKEIVALKNKYINILNKTNKLYILVDDSLGIGAIGPNLKGSLDHAGLSLKNDIDIVCASIELCLDSAGGLIAGSFSKISKCRLFAAGYIFSASSPPYTCTAAIDSFQQIEKNGKEMKQKLDDIKKRFNVLFKDCNIKVSVVGDNNSPCLLLKSDNNKELAKRLNDKGFYVSQQQHLEEDWCQNDFLKLNLGNWSTDDNLISLIEVIEKFQ